MTQVKAERAVFLFTSSMKDEADTLRHDLMHYHTLLRSTLDKKVSDALRQMIAETEERLRQLAAGQPTSAS